MRITIRVSWALFDYMNCASCEWCDPFSNPASKSSIPKLQLYNYHRNDKSWLHLLQLSTQRSSAHVQRMLERFSPRSQSDRACEVAVFKGNRSWSWVIRKSSYLQPASSYSAVRWKPALSRLSSASPLSNTYQREFQGWLKVKAHP